MGQVYSIDDVTVGTSELSIVSGTTSLQTVTTAGKYILRIDAKNTSDPMVKGDYFTVKVYDKVISTGTKDVIWAMTLANAQSGILTSPPFHLQHGWDMTIQKTAGSDSKFDASIIKETADVAEWLGTAVTAATAGLPDVNIKAISNDSAAADNAEAFFDGTGYAGTNNVIPTVTNVNSVAEVASVVEIRENGITNNSISDSAIRLATLDTSIFDTIWTVDLSTYVTPNQAGYILQNLIINLLDGTAGVETNRTLRQALRLILAACVGKASGLATTTAFS